jgi:hypothetical protein
MMRYADRYPKLYQFFAGYFHQDWPDDKRFASASFEAVVHYFQAKNPKAAVSQATRELKELIGLDLSEGELDKIVVDDLGANVNPAGRGLTYRQWLEAVLDILKKGAPS